MAGMTKLGFNDGLTTKSLKHLVPIDIFLAAGIADGEGKLSNRVVFRAQGDSKFYFMFPRGTEETMKPAAGWLQELLEEQARLHDGQDVIPEDPVTDLPTDPLEAR